MGSPYSAYYMASTKWFQRTKLSVYVHWQQLTLNYIYKYKYLVHWCTYTMWYFLSASIIVCDQQLWAIFTHHKNATELLLHWLLYGSYAATLKKSVREAFTRFLSLSNGPYLASHSIINFSCQKDETKCWISDKRLIKNFTKCTTNRHH